ncbi:hypothetical protein OGA32_000101 [Salmonella enterica]|nr:hypothetical protein [Salmonella enterica]
MNQQFQKRIDSLSPEAKELFYKLKPMKGEKVNASSFPVEQIKEIEKASLIYVGRYGGLMIFTDEYEIETQHPAWVEERKKKEVARFLRYKEVQDVILEIVDQIGLDGFKAKFIDVTPPETA